MTVTLHLRYRRRAQRHPALPRPRAPGTASVQSAKFSAHCRIAAAGGRARHSAEFFAQCPPGRAPGRSWHRAGVTGSVTRYRFSNRYRIGNPPGHAAHGQKLVAVVRGTPLAGGRRFHSGRSWYLLSKSSSADFFPGTGENPSQVFSRTGNNQPLRQGLLKSEDTPCPKSGHVPKQDTCPESGLPRAHDMPGLRASSTSVRRRLNI